MDFVDIYNKSSGQNKIKYFERVILDIFLVLKQSSAEVLSTSFWDTRYIQGVFY